MSHSARRPGTVEAELQASNEEVQSANRELQSIHEELETSKEELVDRAFDLGTNAFLFKPSSLEALTAMSRALRDWLGCTHFPQVSPAQTILRVDPKNAQVKGLPENPQTFSERKRSPDFSHL